MNDEVGARIRHHREQQGLSLGQLAERANVSKGYLSALENQPDKRPAAWTLYGIAEALGVNMYDLLGHESQDAPVVPGAGGPLIVTILALARMRQAELARRTGLSTKHVNQLCKGIVPMSIDIALRLEQQLGIPAELWMHADTTSRIAAQRRTQPDPEMT